MILTPSLRKLALTAHVTVSVGWLGALAVFLAHALAAWISRDEQVVRGMAFAMGIAAWFVILPLSLASLTTGVIQAIGTAWGLFRHYWVLFKLLLTAVATIVLLLKLGPISYLAEMTSEASFSSADLIGLRTSLLTHAIGGLLMLFVVAGLAVCKPAGTIRYRAATPRWVKIFGAVLVALVLLLGVMMLIGGHGPGAHAPS